jgi:pyruvate kinase
MPRFTKITSSIGPSSESVATLRKMIQAGVNVCRVNFSHDVGEAQGKKIDNIRKISAELNLPVGVLVDLQGPKHRIGNFLTEEKYPLSIGQEFVFDSNPAPGNSGRVYLPDADVMHSLKVGDRILLNDGKIEMRVTKTNDDSIKTVIVRGNEIWSRRGFNVPDTEIDASVLTEKDRSDLEYAITKNPDWVAVSFVQRSEDIAEVRDFITARTSAPIKIMAKIERKSAVEKISEIAAAADGIMIARGDMAVELPFEQVPAISRHIIRECRRLNRPVVMATQMLGSMVDNEFPTRAEISDVANAAYLRVDSTMTSEETTIGANPVNVIETMGKILEFSDMDAIANPNEWVRAEDTKDNDWSRSVSSMAFLNHAVAIVVFARSTETAIQISCRRPDVQIFAVCDNQLVANQLCIVRGVTPIFAPDLFAVRDAYAALKERGIMHGHIVIVDGDKVSLRSLD